VDNVKPYNNIREIGDNAIVLRNSAQFNIPFSRLAMVDKRPLHSFPVNWENFPDENIKFIRNKMEFNEKLKTYFLKQLSYKVTCTVIAHVCSALHVLLSVFLFSLFLLFCYYVQMRVIFGVLFIVTDLVLFLPFQRPRCHSVPRNGQPSPPPLSVHGFW